MYGGTKEEMLRLVKDAGVVDDSVSSINDVSFDQIITAINKTQQRMGITGTTAKEASGTIQGSVASMKSAWQNMLTGMVDENANFEQLAQDFVSTLITEDGQGGVLGTLVPRIGQVIAGIGTALQTLLPQLINMVVPIIQQNLPVITTAIQNAVTSLLNIMPQVLPVLSQLVLSIVQAFIGMLPQIANTGIQLVLSLAQGITSALPQLIAMIPQLITSIVTVLTENLPQIIDTATNIVLALIQGLTQAIPQLVASIPKLIMAIVTTIVQNLPKITDSGKKILEAIVKGILSLIAKVGTSALKVISTFVSNIAKSLSRIIQSGARILTSLIQGIGQKIGELKTKVQEVGNSIVDKLKEFPSKVLSVGKDIVAGIWKGISGNLGWIKGKIKGWVGNVTSFLKGLFGIHSPSKVTKNEVGKPMVQGMASGMMSASGDIKKASSDIADLASGTMVGGLEKGKKKVKKTAEELSKEVITNANKKVQNLKKANKLAETDEITFWKKITTQVKKGTTGYSTAMANLAKAKNDLKKDVKDLSKTFVEGVSKVNADLDKQIKDLRTAYVDSVNKRKEEIVNSLNLFETVTYDKKISKKTLLKNLSAQVKALRTWDNTLDSLRNKIKNTDLLAELEKKGIGSLPVLEQINSMSKAELAEYEKLYRQKSAIAQERATTEGQELLKQTNAQIATLQANARKQIEALKKTYVKGLKELGIDGSKQSRIVGKQIASGIKSGFSAGMKGVTAQTKAELQTMLKSVKKQLKIKSPSQVYRDEIGDNLARGIGVGFESEMKAITQQMQNAIPTSFDVSPSNARYGTDQKEIDMVSAFKTALSQVKIVLDDEVAGEFVEKTMTRVIYA